MLERVQAIATIPVKNIEVAKKFYEETLGLKVAETEGDEAISYKTGNSTVLVYRSQFAGTNRATDVTWVVPDVEAAVQELKAKGVRFEHYDLPGVTRKGDVHIAGKLKNAWFKDPDGNIHALVSE